MLERNKSILLEEIDTFIASIMTGCIVIATAHQWIVSLLHDDDDDSEVYS